jgi:hypothetical protein
MEIQNKVGAGGLKVAPSSALTVSVGMLSAIYLAVLPMADTIALRNLAILALALLVAVRLLRTQDFIAVPWVVTLWAIFLFAFPFFNAFPDIAWKSFGTQWGMGLLAMFAGAGAALIMRGKAFSSSFFLGVAGCTTIVVHLSLVAWRVAQEGAIPWNYWGRESHHADLGYAAGQSIVLLCASIVAGSKSTRLVAIILVLSCLASTSIAQNRAGLVFGMVGAFLVFATAYLGHGTKHAGRSMAWFFVLMLAGAAVIAVSSRTDSRWHSMWSELTAGMNGKPIQIECEGTASVEQEITDRYGKGEQADRVIASVRGGDGSRVVLLRAGLELVAKHPWGIDGSRQAFQKSLIQECPHPAIQMAHAHNGWIDTALALGWLGAAFYLAVLLRFLAAGIREITKTRELNEWSLVLVALSIFWLCRGFTDSVYRDHMFEMQGFVLAYAFSALMIRQTK